MFLKSCASLFFYFSNVKFLLRLVQVERRYTLCGRNAHRLLSLLNSVRRRVDVIVVIERIPLQAAGGVDPPGDRPARVHNARGLSEQHELQKEVENSVVDKCHWEDRRCHLRRKLRDIAYEKCT